MIEQAKKVRLLAYAPYSSFLVGAALIDENGAVHAGCNVENASYGLAICAERTAASAMIAAGGKKLKGVAVVSTGGVTPCGACRQFLSEFAGDCDVVGVNADTDEIKVWRLADLLPGALSSTDLD